MKPSENTIGSISAVLFADGHLKTEMQSESYGINSLLLTEIVKTLLLSGASRELIFAAVEAGDDEFRKALDEEDALQSENNLKNGGV